eukprot:3872064-Rhodomonas_salina.5
MTRSACGAWRTKSTDILLAASPPSYPGVPASEGSYIITWGPMYQIGSLPALARVTEACWRGAGGVAGTAGRVPRESCRTPAAEWIQVAHTLTHAQLQLAHALYSLRQFSATETHGSACSRSEERAAQAYAQELQAGGGTGAGAGATE